MSGTMKALIYTAPNMLALSDIAIPEPARDEVLVRVEAVGICGSDMHAYHGHDTRRPAPLVLGHEAAGTICSGPRKGDRVAINPLVIDPSCPAALAGRPHLSPTRQIISMPPRPGAFAEFVTIPERNVLPISDRLDFRKAALAEPLAVAWHAVRLGLQRLGQASHTAKVRVIGGGAIGIAAALVARRAGVANLAVAEPNPRRRAFVAEKEAIQIFDPTTTAFDENVDLVIDAVGATSTQAAASRLVRPGGVIVHVGLMPGGEGFDIRRMTLQEITICGSYCYTPADFEATLTAIEAGEFGALDWFEERPLLEGPRAFADLDRGMVAAAKIILLPKGS